MDIDFGYFANNNFRLARRAARNTFVIRIRLGVIQSIVFLKRIGPISAETILLTRSAQAVSVSSTKVRVSVVRRNFLSCGDRPKNAKCDVSPFSEELTIVVTIMLIIPLENWNSTMDAENAR